MPIIIDANRAGDFKDNPKNHAREISLRIRNRQLTLVVGGDLLKELLKTHLGELVFEWIKSGRAKRYNGICGLEDRQNELENAGLESDDPHVIALALVSNCRLIYTDDENLIKDFKNPRLLNPKGKVIKSTTRDKTAITLLDRTR